MKFHGIAEDLLSSREKIRLLKVLCTYPGKEFSSKELSDYSKVSVAGVISILKAFERYGLISYKGVAGTIIWNVNPAHVLFKDLLKPCFDAENNILNSLKDGIVSRLLKFKQVRKVVLFGSLARGEEEPMSDIDVYIETDGLVDTGKIRQELYGIEQEHGNQVSMLFVSRKKYGASRLSPQDGGAPFVLLRDMSTNLKAEIDKGQVLIER